MRTLLPLHHSPLSSPILLPTLLMLWMRATVPPQDTSSPPSLPPPSGQVGSRYEGRSLCAKAKVSRGTASVRQSPLLNPLSGKEVLAQDVASKPKGSGLRRSASLLAELDLSFSSPQQSYSIS